MSKDYYKALGIDKTATADEIKSAYRKLAIKHHPDRNQGDKTSEEKFKEITEAYEVLKDPQKKTMYDQGAYNPQGGFGGGAGGFGGGFSQEGFSDIFSDIFSSFGDIFGGGFSGGSQRNQQQQRGNNLVYEIMISLEEAFSGIKKEIKIKSLYGCDVCNGKGTTSNQGFEGCKTCGGKGRVIVNRGFLRIEQTCSNCKGTGKTIKDPCKTCGGEGRVKKEKKLIIDIPAGIDEGMKIRLSGEGEAGARGAQNGDLFVAVHVANHKFFKREESNLYLSVSIPFVFAALGKVIEIPSISGGVIELKIPEGTQNGQKFRLKGQGMKGLNSKYYGDMYVDISVEIPTSLNKEQKKALESYFQDASDKVVVTNN